MEYEPEITEAEIAKQNLMRQRSIKFIEIQYIEQLNLATYKKFRDDKLKSALNDLESKILNILIFKYEDALIDKHEFKIFSFNIKNINHLTNTFIVPKTTDIYKNILNKYLNYPGFGKLKLWTDSQNYVHIPVVRFMPDILTNYDNKVIAWFTPKDYSLIHVVFEQIYKYIHINFSEMLFYQHTYKTIQISINCEVNEIDVTNFIKKIMKEALTLYYCIIGKQSLKHYDDNTKIDLIDHMFCVKQENKNFGKCMGFEYLLEVDFPLYTIILIQKDYGVVFDLV